MCNIRFLVRWAGLLLLVGCTGIGVIATSDPDQKMRDADYLWRKEDRPLPAERLISEAIAIYQKQGNLRSLGDAYREYGNLLLSRSLTKWGSHITQFNDPSVANVTYENRGEKALEYFRKALEVYQKYEQQPLDAKQYDKLTSLYYVTAWTYNALNEPDNSCKYFNESLVAYAENIRLNPSANPSVPPGFKSFPDLVVANEDQLDLDCRTENLNKK